MVDYIKTYNQNLNASVQGESNWSAYAKEVTDYILKYGELDKNMRVLILGAGYCRDLQLDRLIKTGARVTLSDVDEVALTYAKSQLEEGDQEKVTLEVMDYLEIVVDHTLEGFMDLLKTHSEGKEAEELQTYLRDYLIRLVQEPINPDSLSREVERGMARQEAYDLIICLPIYTQLIFGPIREACGLYLKGNPRLRDQILQEVLDYMPRVIDRFNRLMLSRLKNTTYGQVGIPVQGKKGKVIVFSDLLEDSPSGPVSLWYNEGGAMEAYWLNYCQSYGPGLGGYGLENLEDYVKVGHSKWFCWSFSEDRKIFVKGLVSLR